MRIRTLALVGLLTAGSVLLLAGPAAAEDPGTKAAKELRECVEQALHDNSNATDFKNALEDCNKAKSIITPAVPEMIWGGLAFAIVALVLMKYAFPLVKKSLKAREDKIRGDLEGAEKARADAEEEKRRYEASLAESRGEANRIVEEAREAAEQVRRDLIARAEADAADVRARAQEDARLAAARAMTDLQGRVADISIELAERIVERNLDRDTQLALVESYISSVGNGTQG
jgi:F-type H+-transporting ATPase subunit b